ncbi:MAG: hypothetical protein CMF59_05470 [Leptospiraceae bacterium]|nr:hypothetical protein [Leptospiraceae bacterium]
MSTTFSNATLNNGISGLDSQCSFDSNKPSGGGKYKARVADSTNRIACSTANCNSGTDKYTDWVLRPSQKYTRADGTTVGTTNANGVFSFPLDESSKSPILTL